MLSDVVEVLKSGKTAEDAKAMIDNNYSLEMGENLQVRDFQVIEGASVGAYVHSNNKLAAVVVAKVETSEEKLKQVAMHITAANPEFLAA
jgi:elongation factor Ts